MPSSIYIFLLQNLWSTALTFSLKAYYFYSHFLANEIKEDSWFDPSCEQMQQFLYTILQSVQQFFKI